MVDLSLATDEFGLLRCTLADGQATATVAAADRAEAAAGLLAALNNTAQNGVGECFWQRASGEYRWLLRREKDSVRLVVLWSTSAITGWENVFWADTDWVPLERQFREKLENYAA